MNVTGSAGPPYSVQAGTPQGIQQGEPAHLAVTNALPERLPGLLTGLDHRVIDEDYTIAGG